METIRNLPKMFFTHITGGEPFSRTDLKDCSTCDMHCAVNNGLSETGKAQLEDKTGEEIVDADIAAQMKQQRRAEYAYSFRTHSHI